MKSKKIIRLALVGVTLVSSMVPVFAESNSTTVVRGKEPIPVHYNVQPQDSFGGLHLNIVVNGKGLNFEDTKVFIRDDHFTMLPLKLVSEALGYHVVWNSENKTVELIKGAQWTSVKIGEDRYTFGRMAPFSLGTAPEIKNGRTYIPLEFVTEVLKASVLRDETGSISISNQTISELGTEGEIIKIQKMDQNTRIFVKGMAVNHGAYNEILLNINHDTKLENPLEDENKISVEDLKEGDHIRVFYGPGVTRSIPPIGNAKKIEILKDVTVRDGQITDIKINEERSQILIGSMTSGVILIINDDTQIVTEDNRELSIMDLTVGMNIKAYHSLMMTMSIPGMTTAKKIVVQNI